MGLEVLLAFLVIGAAAGWIAGLLFKGSSFGFVGNLVVGIVGSFVGGFLFSLLGLGATGIIGSLVTATVGAVVLLWGLGQLKRK